MHGLLQKLLPRAPVFLDSADLVDLREIFTDGVHVSETITLLATPRVLTRPWCLLELWQAAARGKPLVVVHIAARGLELSGGTAAIHARFLEDARILLQDLPAQLASRVSACAARSSASTRSTVESSVRIGCVWEVSMLPSSGPPHAAHYHGQNTRVTVG